MDFEIVREPIRWVQKFVNASTGFIDSLVVGVQSILLAPVVFIQQLARHEIVLLVPKDTQQPTQVISPDDGEDWKRQHDELYGGNSG
jgi:hypothetical protein